MIYTVEDFSIVSEAEVDVLQEFPCFFSDPTDFGNLMSGSTAFSKSLFGFPSQLGQHRALNRVPCATQ